MQLSQIYKTFFSYILVLAVLGPTITQAATCNRDMLLSMETIDAHADTCCPPTDRTPVSDSGCGCCDCGIMPDNTDPAASAVTVDVQKLQEPTVTDSAEPPVRFIQSTEYLINYSEPLRSPSIPVYLKNRVLLN